MAIRSERPTDAVIIGAGIAGCTLAYELATRGLGVTVYDQGPIAAESSGRNTGTLFSGPQEEVVRLLLACAEIYDELAAGPVKFGWRKIDHLLIAGDDARLDATAGLVGRIAALGIGVQPVSGQELARDFPQLGFSGCRRLRPGYGLEPGAAMSTAGSAPSACIRGRPPPAGSPTPWRAAPASPTCLG